MAEKIEKRSVSIRIDGKEVESSYKAILREVTALRQENQKLSEDTEGYVRKALSLAQASEAAQKNRDSVKTISEAWKSMPDDVRESVIEQQTALLKLRETFGTLMESGESTRSPQMKALKAQMLELQNSIVETTQKYVEMQKPVSNSIAAIKKELTLLEKEIETVAQDSDTYRQKMARWQELNTIVETHKNTLKGIEPAVKGSLEALEQDIKEVETALNKSVLKSKEYYRNIEKLNELNTELDEHKKSLGQIEDAWYKNIPAIKGFAAAAIGAFAIDKIAEYGKALLNNATIMETNLRKSSSVLGESLGKINNEAERHAKSFGVARSQYVGAAADMSAFFQSQFASREEGAKLSAEAVKLAGVLAGFKGGGAEQFTEALEAIKGGFSDNVEELAKFNIALSDDVIKAALAEKGIDKLNAKQQEHAKGLVLLQLIQEKANAQIAAFGDMSDTSARKQAELVAMLKEIGDNLSKILIPILGKFLALTKPAIDFFADIAEYAAAAADTVRGTAEAFENQKASVNDLTKNINPLLSRYDTLVSKTSLTKKEQNELKDITQKIGEVVPIAASSFDDYGKAMSVNTTVAREFIETEKVRLQYLNESAIAAQKSALFQMELQRDLLAAQLETKKTSRIVDLNTMQTVEQDITNEQLKQTQELLNTIQKRIDGANAQIKYLEGGTLKLPELSKKPDLSGESQSDKDKRKKEQEEIAKFIKDYQDKLKAFRADNEQIVEEGYVKEIKKTQEKYQKELDLLDDFAKKYPKVRKTIEGFSKDTLQLQTQEVVSIVKNQIRDLEAAAIKYQQDAELRLKSQEDKEIAAINDKYKKQIDLLTKLENDVQNVTEAERQKAHTLRLTYETNRETEIANMKSRLRFEQAQKDAEENKRFWEQMKQMNDQYLALLNEKPVSIPLDEENNVEAKVQNIIDVADAERAALNKKFDEQIKLEGDASDRILALNNKRSELLQAIALKTNAQIEKTEKDSLQKRIQAQSAAAQELGSLFVSLSNLIAGETAKNTTIQKVAALAQIAINTATAIASIVAKSAATSVTPIDYAIKVAAGIATVMVNMLNARNILNAVPTVTQKNDGGPVEVIGATDGKTYRPKYKGQAETGMYYEPSLFLAAENRPEYVIAYPELQNPLIANFLPVIEAVRRRRVVRAYDDGGLTQGTVAPPVPQQPGMISLPIEMFNAFMGIMQKVDKALERGIILSYEDVEHIDKMRSSIQNARGY